MKRLKNIIEQDAAIWELTDDQIEIIFSKAIVNALQVADISEDNLIHNWVLAFREIVPSFEAEIIPYKPLDRSAEFTWMKEHPHSWINGA
jgi:hypothetical protein